MISRKSFSPSQKVIVLGLDFSFWAYKLDSLLFLFNLGHSLLRREIEKNSFSPVARYCSNTRFNLCLSYTLGPERKS